MKIDKQISERFGPNAASVWTVLCERAERATLEDDGRRYFFCPIGRRDGIEGAGYRPLIDRLPWMAEQTIRDSVRRFDREGMVQVMPKADKRAFVRNAEGRRTQTRTHCYHVPDALLDEIRAKKKSEFVFFKDEEAVAHGINAALVLNEMRFELGKVQVKNPQTQIIHLSAKKLASRLPISKSSIRRAVTLLMEKRELIKMEDGGYSINGGTTIKLNNAKWSRKGATLPAQVESPAPGALFAMRKIFVTDKYVPTGLRALDDKIREFQKGQLGFLFGYTGHGKTALMMQMALGAARSGKNALVISLEETKEHLANRLYANYFGLDYSKLHLDDAAEWEKCNVAMASLGADEKLALRGIRIVEHRETKATIADLKVELDGLAKEGYYPDVVYVDQFSYLKPTKEVSASWENEQNLAVELNEWAASSLQGPYPFVLWVLAQAKGEPSKAFDRDAICGRKEIIQPASLAIGIGHTRDDPRKLTLFSLKVRHNADFGLTFKCDLSKMRIGLEDESSENVGVHVLTLAS